ncbi:hypothetical protein [Nitrobacter sp. Nb-311A]|uniref:hypothetical protein n=1 Tax=Nitrobacter sp. Nb-311A TaxID=314253 RepID=UPI0003102DCB|nr:hypothetical protein [Nitrobacter sp. Nb-311A]
MTDSDSSYGVSDAFLDHLDQLARQNSGSWWRDVLKRDDVFLAVRRNSLNVYYRGGSIFRIDDRGDGTASPKTHVKYLVRQQQALAELVDGEFRPNGIGWTHYAGQETLRDMIRAASDLAGAEKSGLHPMIMGSPAVVDVEIALGRAQEREGNGSMADGAGSSANRSLDRLDVATLERQGTDIAVVFHEAKHFTNTALRARSGVPAVVGQLRRYRSTLSHHTPALIARYQAACRAILRLGAMRRHVRSDSGAGVPLPCDPMVQEVATGNAGLTIDPKPRLIIFGFDADQKKGQLQVILNALKTADPNVMVYAAGDPSSAGGAFRPPTKL